MGEIKSIEQQLEGAREILEAPLADLPRVDRSLRQFHTYEECESAFGFELPLVVRNLFKQPFVAQRTPDWTLARQDAITSSDMAAAIGANPYQSVPQVIQKKVRGSNIFNGNKATEHGNFYEDCALFLYESKSGYKTIDFGLLSHHKLFDSLPDDFRKNNDAKMDYFKEMHKREDMMDYTWLKGSPDGVAVNPQTKDAVLLEIKCPYSHTNFKPQKIQSYYYPQVQMMMHLFNLSACHFVQFLPADNLLVKQLRFDLLVVERNNVWMEAAIKSARVVWKVIKYQRAVQKAEEEKAALMMSSSSSSAAIIVKFPEEPKEPEVAAAVAIVGQKRKRYPKNKELTALLPECVCLPDAAAKRAEKKEEVDFLIPERTSKIVHASSANLDEEFNEQDERARCISESASFVEEKKKEQPPPRPQEERPHHVRLDIEELKQKFPDISF